MGILQDLGTGIRAEATTALLLASCFFSAGCRDRTSLPPGNEAVDSRSSVIEDGVNLTSHQMPKIPEGKIELRLGDEAITRLQLAPEKSYVLTLPPGKFVEVYGAVGAHTGTLSRTYRTNESFVFELPDNDLSHFKLSAQSLLYCAETRNDVDGTYYALIDTSGKTETVISAVKIGAYGTILPSENKTHQMFYFKTPDQVIHRIAPPEQRFYRDNHGLPHRIWETVNKIDRVHTVKEIQEHD